MGAGECEREGVAARGGVSVTNGKPGDKNRRSYRPVVEAMEALRLLSNAAQMLPGLAFEQEMIATGGPLAFDPGTVPGETWDTALVQTQLADILGTNRQGVDAEALTSGLSQLNRYLTRSWYRAGIPVQFHDDSSQAVYVTLLGNLGRDRFDGLVEDIGRVGIRDVMSRETAEGPDFFRAIDMVKKRAQRERNFVPLDTIDLAASQRQDETRAEWRVALHEAINQSLSPREAALMHATLQGETPAEIASRWGVAPKTVSNEKTRVIQKLREVLTAEMSN
jgi:RNA polymerase sigma factor (sigma-70 family)